MHCILNRQFHQMKSYNFDTFLIAYQMLLAGKNLIYLLSLMLYKQIE